MENKPPRVLRHPAIDPGSAGKRSTSACHQSPSWCRSALGGQRGGRASPKCPRTGRLGSAVVHAGGRPREVAEDEAEVSSPNSAQSSRSARSARLSSNLQVAVFDEGYWGRGPWVAAVHGIRRLMISSALSPPGARRCGNRLRQSRRMSEPTRVAICGPELPRASPRSSSPLAVSVAPRPAKPMAAAPPELRPAHGELAGPPNRSARGKPAALRCLSPGPALNVPETGSVG